MKKRVRRVLSYVLSMALLLSSMTIPKTVVNAATEGSQEQTAVLQKITDVVGVLVDGQQAGTLQLYQNGVYEGKVTLNNEAGSELQLIRNGEAIGEARTVTAPAGTEVYVRYQDGQMLDSITNADRFHTAAFTGDFTGLTFVDEETKEYSIVNWTPADANAELTYVGGGIFKRTFSFKELAEDTNIQYKVAFDDGWDYSIGDGGSNINITIPKDTTKVTVFADEINQVVYDSIRSEQVTVNQNTGDISYSPLELEVSLIGTIRGTGAEDWTIENTDFEFTQISDTLFVYQMVAAKGSYQYKVTFNHEKWYEFIAGNKDVNVTEESQNLIFVYDAKTQALYDSVNDQSTLSILFGMESEPAASEVVNNANGTTRFITTAAQSENDKVELVYADRNDAKNETTVTLTKGADTQGIYNGSFETADLFFGDEAIDYVYYYLVNGVKVLDASAPTVSVDGIDYSNYTREAFTGRVVNVPGTFPGASWDAASNQMNYEGNGLYSYTFENVPPANYEFKISMGSWTENYGVDGVKDGSNYSVTVTSTQDVTVYYTDLVTHLAVTSINYIFADITLAGRNIIEGTKLTDPGLTGIYSNQIVLPAGTYTDLTLTYKDHVYEMDAFTLEEEKAVTFYFDPSTEIYYNNSTETEIDATAVCYDSKDIEYKSVFGAIEEGQKVTLSIKTGEDVTKAKVIIKGKTNQVVDLVQGKDGDSTCWAGDVTISEYGEYQYFFVLYYGSYIKVYCDDDGYYGKGVLTDLSSLKPYDLVVYKAGYTTPDWMKNAVIYQIFPDRFCNGDVSNDTAQTSARGAIDYEFITDWSTLPENPEQEALNPDTYPSNAYVGDGNWSNEIYGGDIEGIISKIEYLKALGVNVIYLNPIFSSISSHRYDTSDYTKIDPILGTLGDFSELVAVCEQNDMHVVLDGVFNHVSDDSVYFDRYYKFVGKDGKVGAYPYWAYVYDYMEGNNVEQDEAITAAREYFTGLGVNDFTYTEWFNIYNTSYVTDDDGNIVKDTIGERAGKDVYGYDGWWGYDSMPVVKSVNGSEYQTASWADEIIDGQDSVCTYWLKEGSDGWRLDVANEVSDETWQHFRTSVKALNSENVIIGEIWDDATEYLLGDMYDSVMNYIFRNAVLGFAKGGDASESVAMLEKIRERYPAEAFYAMMNLVGSHDTTRLLSYLDGVDDDRNQKEVDKAFPSYAATSDKAKASQYLVAFIQMTYPGAPTIYYGDEIGMVGADDPDDRRAMTWGEGNKELVEWYATMAKIREQYTALRTGDIVPFEITEDGQTKESLMAYVRSDASDQLVVVGNNATEDAIVSIDLASYISLEGTSVTDVVSGKTYEVTAGKVTVTVPAYKGIVLTENAKEIRIDNEALRPAYDPNYAEVPVQGVTLDKTNAVLTVGETMTLTAIIAPADATNASLSWTSSDATVATVDNGVVSARKAGITVITVTAADQITASCIVIVKEQVVSPEPSSSAQPSGSPEPSSSAQPTATPAVKVDKVTGFSVTKKSTSKVALKWKKVAGAAGYQIYMKTNSGTYKKIKTITNGTTVSYVKSGLTQGYRYSFKVRAYKKLSNNTVYGSFCGSKTVRMGIAKPSKITLKQVSKTKVKITFPKVAGVSGYEVSMKYSSGNKYKKVATLTKSSKNVYTKTGLKKGRTYTFKVRAYKVVNGKKYYSSYTNLKKITLK